MTNIEHQVHVQIRESCFRALQISYDNDSLKNTAVYEWFSKFQFGNESLEDVSHSGRPELQPLEMIEWSSKRNS